MILLLTRKEYDQGTDPVVEWLQYYKADFLKVFVEDLVSNKNKHYIDVINGIIWANNKNLTETVNVIWYRRFGESVALKLPDDQIFKQLNYECGNEVAYLTNYIFFSLKDKTWMPHYSMVDVNKLEILQQARSAGLQVPETIIVNNRDCLEHFYISHNKSIVTKPIHFSGYYIKDEYTHSSYTSEIPPDFISYLPEVFFPTQVQEKIQAAYQCIFLHIVHTNLFPIVLSTD